MYQIYSNTKEVKMFLRSFFLLKNYQMKTRSDEVINGTFSFFPTENVAHFIHFP